MSDEQRFRDIETEFKDIHDVITAMSDNLFLVNGWIDRRRNMGFFGRVWWLLFGD